MTGDWQYEKPPDAVDESALYNPEVPSSYFGDANPAVVGREEGWEEATDPASGTKYWFNTMSGTSQWECPAGYQPQAVAAAGESSDESSMASYHIQMPGGVGG
ncbi:unnamed protein product [Chrysoparadoxa australica]